MKNGSRTAATNGVRPYVLITGGSGFIGANLASRLLRGGEDVLLYDNLSRPGVEENFRWLQAEYGAQVRLQRADTRDRECLASAVAGSSAVYHFAAQVAVTSSIENPSEDFAINVGGTLNLLEALRTSGGARPLFFTSTNKVYGALENVTLQPLRTRYQPADAAVRTCGIAENQALDFYSPYGCSKGAADQYVLDYARTFGLPAVVFRMSCIYGPRQFGTEDQGWVAHFLIRALEHQPITLYGDGKQVRDILFVEDLVEAFSLARSHLPAVVGKAFNIGGGPENTTSLLELMELITEIEGGRPDILWGEWRTGDQRYYVSDFQRFRGLTGWRPRVDVRDGVRRLHSWLRSTRSAEALVAA